MMPKECFHVWDAVVAWRDHIFQTTFFNITKCNYLTGMLKLIESEIIDVRTNLSQIDDVWLEEAKKKISENSSWSKATKPIRKCCLNLFYKFIACEFDYKTQPYLRHPEPIEIKHVLSSVKEKTLTKNICPKVLCNALYEINERDAYIICLMMHTYQPLEAILNCRKEDFNGAYMRFGNHSSKYIPKYFAESIIKLAENNVVYFFETSAGNRIHRNQITRNLKQAGKNIGLDFDLTPKILHGYVCAYLVGDKRSELARALLP